MARRPPLSPPQISSLPDPCRKGRDSPERPEKHRFPLVGFACFSAFYFRTHIARRYPETDPHPPIGRRRFCRPFEFSPIDSCTLPRGIPISYFLPNRRSFSRIFCVLPRR